MGLIWGSIWLFYPHGEGGGRGNFEFCGMVEAVRVVVRGWQAIPPSSPVWLER